MLELLKPYLEKAVHSLMSQTVPLTCSAALVLLLWLYADLHLASPLSKSEVIGFSLIAFFAFWCLYRLLRSLRRFLPAAVLGLAVLSPPSADASSLTVVEVVGGKEQSINLENLSLIRLHFPVVELVLATQPTEPEEETDCLIYNRRSDPNFHAKFCGYSKMFSSGTSSLVADTSGKVFYAYDLYDLETGGGGNVGLTLDLPSTRLRDYQSRNGLEIEGLCRAILPRDPYEDGFHNFGLYGFLLLRDRGMDIEKKKKLVESFLDIIPEFSADAFGVTREKLAVLVYPTKLSSDDIYQGFNAGGWEGEQGDGTSDALLQGYDYAFATDALKRLRRSTGLRPPEISMVFARSKSEKMTMADIDWENSVVFDLSQASGYSEIFVDLNNFFVYDIERPPSDVFEVVRRFADSTGRLALIAFDGAQ